MVFAPDDVANHTFVAALRGYDKVEVDSFLRAVAADYAELTGEVAALRHQLDEKTRELDDLKPEYRDAMLEGSEARSEVNRLRTDLARNALALGLIAHTVRRAAEKDADGIRERAEQNAESMVTLAQRSAGAIVLRAAALARAITDGTLRDDETDHVAELLASWRSEQERALDAAVAAVDDVRAALLHQRAQIDGLTELKRPVPDEPHPDDDQAVGAFPDVRRAG